jgi:hypothetical protein
MRVENAEVIAGFLLSTLDGEIKTTTGVFAATGTLGCCSRT